jgi:hypothetical protein
MKTLIASIFAVAMLGAGAANAGSVIGAHIGPVGIGIGVHGHHRHCAQWGRHHHRCHRWG